MNKKFMYSVTKPVFVLDKGSPITMSSDCPGVTKYGSDDYVFAMDGNRLLIFRWDKHRESLLLIDELGGASND